MICKSCGRECTGSLRYCRLCGADLLAEEKRVKFPEKTESSEAPAPAVKSGVNANIYKLLCICMGLCLIAGSVVWAAIMLRDRIDAPVRADEAVPVTNAPEEKKTTTRESTTTTKPTTTTTTTTTTTDPYKVTVEPDFIEDYGTMYVIADELIMRIGPGYDYTRLDTTVPNGTALDLEAEKVDPKSGESWCYIEYGGEKGWVSKSFLSSTNPTVAVVLPDEYYYGSSRTEMNVSRYGGLKLYSGPGTGYDYITTIPEGESITKEGYNYFSVKWVYISYGDQFGWIQSYEGDWFNPTIE